MIFGAVRLALIQLILSFLLQLYSKAEGFTSWLDEIASFIVFAVWSKICLSKARLVGLVNRSVAYCG